MDTDVMIQQLRSLAEKHKDDKISTFETRWSDLCTDVANRLEEQENMISVLRKDFESAEEHRKFCESLLGEQSEQIAIMKMIYGSDVKYVGELVRCKDCKHYREHGKYCGYDPIWQDNKGHIFGLHCEPDWFCADGVTE